MTLGELFRQRVFEEGRFEHDFILFEDERYTWGKTWEEAVLYAHVLRCMRDTDRPFHVGVLSENCPEFIFGMLGCGLSGAAMVGLNHTHRGADLARDIVHSDCQILLAHGGLCEHLAAIEDELPRPLRDRTLVWRRAEMSASPQGARDAAEVLRQTADALGGEAGQAPEVKIGDETQLLLIFTSGTTGAPKAILNSHRKFTSAAAEASAILGLTGSDTVYAAMPLFHFSSLLPSGWAIVAGCRLAIAPRFSAGGFLPDVRRHGVTIFNCVGKPLSFILATPELPDDASSPLRVVSSAGTSARQQEEFARRFGLERLVEIYGASEAGIPTVVRAPGDPPGSIGALSDEIVILDENGRECPPAEVDVSGRLLNYHEAVGEITNARGVGAFEGYYKNPEATAAKIRGGRYRSGDLGYCRIFDRDGRPARFLYFAGRTDDWIRKDGENFVAEPVEAIVQRHPDVVLCSIYGVPCALGDEEVMAALVLDEAARFEPRAFYEFLSGQPDLSPKWMPDYVRISPSLPQTETMKVLRRQLKTEHFDLDQVPDPIYWRERGEAEYKRFTAADLDRVRDAFSAAGRPEALRARDRA